jgi:uncharacterized protein (TIGR02246 family)
MFKRTLTTAILVAALSTVSFSQTKPTDANVKAIQDTEASWVKACATKDAEKIMAFYTDDAIFIANSPTVTGKAAILSAWKGMVSDPNFSLKFSSTRVDVAKSGELAYSYGTYTLTISDPKTKKPMTDRGKYITVFKKQADGSWKAAADVANSDPPPAPAK